MSTTDEDRSPSQVLCTSSGTPQGVSRSQTLNLTNPRTTGNARPVVVTGLPGTGRLVSSKVRCCGDTHPRTRPCCPNMVVLSCRLAACGPRSSREERLIFLDGQVHHSTHTALMGNYVIKVEIT
jgi:hypothetical protein